MARPGDLYGPPIREASVRGGSGRFNWDDVKKDEKFRDTYIGHSLKAPVGRWQKGKDLTWYAKPRAPPSADEARTARLEEVRRIKELEEEALAEALGFKVERKSAEEGAGVTKEELESVLKEEEGRGEEVEGTTGLGFGSGGLRVGARMPDGRIVQEQGVTVEVDVKIKREEGLEEQQEQGEGGSEKGDKGRRRHRHRHRRRDEDEERSRHKHRHHRRDDEHRARSRSPHSRRERESDRERRSDRQRDSDREERRDESRRREHRGREDSPRREYRDRRDRDRDRDRDRTDRDTGREGQRTSYDTDRRHRRRDYTPDTRD